MCHLSPELAYLDALDGDRALAFRVEQWVAKLSQRPGTPLWARDRNRYATLLAARVAAGDLSGRCLTMTK